MNKREYRAAVLLQIEPPPPPFASVSDALLVGAGNYWQNTDFYNTQFRVLRSKGLGEKVVARLKLTDREPFKSSSDPATLFMSHVGVEPVPESRLVLVSATHRDPREAALWANTLGEVYIEQSLAQRIDSARKAYDWLQERLAATQVGDEGRAGQALPELPHPGPLRARGQRLRRLHLDRPAQRGLRPGPDAADHHRGGAQAGARDAGARARSSTPCPRSPPTPR